MILLTTSENGGFLRKLPVRKNEPPALFAFRVLRIWSAPSPYSSAENVRQITFSSIFFLISAPFWSVIVPGSRDACFRPSLSSDERQKLRLAVPSMVGSFVL